MITFRLPKSAIETGQVRLHFKRTPLHSCTLVASRIEGGKKEQMGEAHIYGRGEGSDATEHVIVPIRLNRNSSAFESLNAGDLIAVQVKDLDGKESVSDLELLEII